MDTTRNTRRRIVIILEWGLVRFPVRCKENERRIRTDSRKRCVLNAGHHARPWAQYSRRRQAEVYAIFDALLVESEH